MIKAKELMLGNIVNEEVLGDVPVFEIHEGYCVLVVNHLNIKKEIEHAFYSINLININPINITQEWLLRFGFKKDTERVYISTGNGDYSSQIMWFNGQVHLKGNKNNTMELPHIKYLHQIQNLYLALAKKKLTIKD